MLLTRKRNEPDVYFIDPATLDLEGMLEREWLLTNSRGGFASGTVAGCNVSHYHSLLSGSLNPPGSRIAALANCLERACFEDGSLAVEFSTFEFPEHINPSGFQYLKGFSNGMGVHFDYETEDIEFTRSIYLLPDSDTTAIVYDFKRVDKPFSFDLRPLAAMRDHHHISKTDRSILSTRRKGGVLITTDDAQQGELFLNAPEMVFNKDPQWWYNFHYRRDMQQGRHCREDLWTPGWFRRRVDEPCRVVFWANLSLRCEVEEEIDFDIDIVIDSLKLRQSEWRPRPAKLRDKPSAIEMQLHTAASKFLVERHLNGVVSNTIIAGYPWFLDWGRDTFISLPGVLLCTGKYEEAASVLGTYAEALDEGMIPNRFDDNAHTADYNSIDASLWFVHACFEYLDKTADRDMFITELLKPVIDVISAYNNGTKYDIHASSDGLIMCGSENMQLTWMDAKRDGVVFTPRYGKCVEINALWYSNLRRLEQFLNQSDPESASFYGDLADSVGAHFCERFWNWERGCLNDCIYPDGNVDTHIRPNQIFAVSLPFSPLLGEQRFDVVKTVEHELLTPYGLRTLSPHDIGYKGRYEGNMFERDSAYHQGTVWPWLIGPFIEAYLNVHNFSDESKDNAHRMLMPLLEHLSNGACIGSVSEVFDGDPPHRPGGCVAQAWSVAELLRAWKLVNS